MDSYGELLFTQSVQDEQARAGTRDSYAAAYTRRFRGPLDADAQAFIRTRDSFYIASVSQSGWPYMQHRGGPPGFLKVLGPERIGFADYPGNKQFITKGNLTDDTRVALFLMDYPRKARLKLLGRARMIDVADDPALAQQLAQPGQAKAERLTTIDVVAMDWNCPKYITPRFTEAEIDAMLGPRIAEIQADNAALRARIKDLEGPTT